MLTLAKFFLKEISAISSAQLWRQLLLDRVGFKERYVYIEYFPSANFSIYSGVVNHTNSYHSGEQRFIIVSHAATVVTFTERIHLSRLYTPLR